MTERSNSGGYCGNCGNPLSPEDRFCGACGSVIPSATGEDARVLSRSESTNAYESYQSSRTSRNRSAVMVAACTLILLIVGGAAFALTRDNPGDETARNESPAPSDSGGEADGPEGSPMTTVREETSSEEPGTASGSPPDTSAPTAAELEEEARQEIEDYYEALNSDNFSYTYAHKDSRTQAAFTEEEWVRRNQWLESNNPTTTELVDVDLDEVTLSPDEPTATVQRELTVDSTGYSEIRESTFVYEDGMWVVQYPEGGMPLYMPEATFEEFVAANSG